MSHIHSGSKFFYISQKTLRPRILAFFILKHSFMINTIFFLLKLNVKYIFCLDYNLIKTIWMQKNFLLLVFLILLQLLLSFHGQLFVFSYVSKVNVFFPYNLHTPLYLYHFYLLFIKFLILDLTLYFYLWICLKSFFFNIFNSLTFLRSIYLSFFAISLLAIFHSNQFYVFFLALLYLSF